ncbi:MAG: hydroxyacylglutathione hydrolase [Paracoccaceae bacterium]|jgi:hydroxyacylglutathione hydrolase|nr:hydroxyacylglutathione hydrolase [Paracoccaceae bacterium]
MPLEIITIPCLSDNYAYLAHDAATGQTMVVDVPEAAPILEALKHRGWILSHVLLTHHHWDHIDGLGFLLQACPAEVIGATADAHRLPNLDRKLHEGDRLQIGSDYGEVIDVSGHTLGHIAVYFPKSKVVFTADSLMALGCGRLFEGSPQLMHQSLEKLAALPPDTLIYSGHEYTISNLKFAQSIEPDNPRLIIRGKKIVAARSAGRPTVPELLSEELATNPFLRANTVEVRKALALEDAEDWEVFAEVRSRKDHF